MLHIKMIDMLYKHKIFGNIQVYQKQIDQCCNFFLNGKWFCKCIQWSGWKSPLIQSPGEWAATEIEQVNKYICLHGSCYEDFFSWCQYD